jgi:hypothetical protein
VSDPAAPVEVGFYDTEEYAWGVAVAGSYAYVADYYDGLRVVDVSDPTAPTEVGFYDTPGNACDVVVTGGYAYVADYGAGLRVVDVSDPAAPVEVGFYDTPGDAFGVAVVGSYAFVADGDGGLRVVDASDPTTPHGVAFYYTPDLAKDVAVAGGLAYVADLNGGLLILRYTGLTYSVSGRVTDGGDNPMAGVSLSAPGGYSAVSDVEGEYAIDGLFPGSYSLTPALEGYGFDPVTRSVDVPPDATGQDFVGEAVVLKVYLPVVMRSQ